MQMGGKTEAWQSLIFYHTNTEYDFCLSKLHTTDMGPTSKEQGNVGIDWTQDIWLEVIGSTECVTTPAIK